MADTELGVTQHRRSPQAASPFTLFASRQVRPLALSPDTWHLDRDVTTGHAERTPVPGDEPRDIVFAGPERRQAFIPRPRRGQNIPAGNSSRGSWAHLGQCGRGKVNALIGCA
jgi:hypothetical protein